MVFAKHSCSLRLFLLRKKWVLYLLVRLSLTILIIWARFLILDKFSIDMRFPFKASINPPGVSLIVYSLIVFAHIIFLCISFPLETIPILRTLIVGGKIIGRHTLYFFVSHFFLSTVIPFFFKGIGIFNAWIIRIIYLTFMTVGPICLENIFAKVRQAIFVAYQ